MRNGRHSSAGAAPEKAAAAEAAQKGDATRVSQGSAHSGTPSGRPHATGSPETVQSEPAPTSGAPLSPNGASPSSPGTDEPSRRRRRRKRRGKGSRHKAENQSSHTEHSSAPLQSEAHEHNEKRDTAGNSASARSGQASSATGGHSQENAVAGEDAPSGKSRRKRRRGRARKQTRELQGTPLRCGEAAPVPAADQSDPRGPRKDKAEGATAVSGDQPGSARHAAPRFPPRGGARPRRDADDLYAALDLGTNNCRLLVAQPTRPGQFRVVDAFSRIVRLGEGLAANGRLSDDAMNRSIEALRVCAGKLGSRRVRMKRLIATEACRAAGNGAEFLERVRRETALELEVVDRETEARLAVAGCSSLIDRDTKGLVLFDIGGGSSEIAMIDLSENRSNRLANHIRAWTSLPVGVVTLSERHGGSTVTRQSFEAMVAEVETMLARFMPPDLPAFAPDADPACFHLLGTSGTVTTLAGLHLELPRYDRRKVDGVWLSRDDVDRTLERLLTWDFNQRAANPCIGADRADLVLAGCAILEAIRKRWPSERMRVADRGLREGLLNEMMGQDGAWRRAGRRYRSKLRAAPLYQHGGSKP
ncbi:Ppx/GppA phosphatase family protein [Pseudohoeflea sp. DP4N28-3]|uniref:Exopolyphosphatase n=1 Tax=Pseudohoeflea coraliihabitans TaxID=2860393 RepID=A0ABS6WP00_9HYPH|nr:exopolyphosphatase [Pseudohoeflea sp. DP4N28-3]